MIYSFPPICILQCKGGILLKVVVCYVCGCSLKTHFWEFVVKVPLFIFRLSSGSGNLSFVYICLIFGGKTRHPPLKMSVLHKSFLSLLSKKHRVIWNEGQKCHSNHVNLSISKGTFQVNFSLMKPKCTNHSDLAIGYNLIFLHAQTAQ